MKNFKKTFVKCLSEIQLEISPRFQKALKEKFLHAFKLPNNPPLSKASYHVKLILICGNEALEIEIP